MLDKYFSNIYLNLNSFIRDKFEVTPHSVPYLAALISVSEEVRSRCHLKHRSSQLPVAISESTSSDSISADLSNAPPTVPIKSSPGLSGTGEISQMPVFNTTGSTSSGYSSLVSFHNLTYSSRVTASLTESSHFSLLWNTSQMVLLFAMLG